MSYISTSNGSQQPMFLAVTSVLLLLSCISVALRWYCRVVYVRKLGWDDYLIAAALAVTLVMGIMNAVHVSLGTSQHIDDYALDDIIVPIRKHWYAFQIVYPLAIGLVKFSILAQYHRIFIKQTFRAVVIGVAISVLIYTIVVIFVNAFECHTKPWRAWDPTFPEGCNNLSAVYFSTAGINIVTDFVILLLPFPVLWRLNLQSRRKWALVAILLTGSLASAASIVRLHALYVYGITHDESYDAINVLLWSQVEANVAIISASTPSLRPLVRPIWSIFRGSSCDREHRDTLYMGYRLSGSRYRPRPNPDIDGVLELPSGDEEDQNGRLSMPTLPSRASARGQARNGCWARRPTY